MNTTSEDILENIKETIKRYEKNLEQMFEKWNDGEDVDSEMIDMYRERIIGLQESVRIIEEYIDKEKQLWQKIQN